MKVEHWMQLIVGVIILGTLGFLSIHVFDMKGVLEGMRTKVDATETRVGRIADALPDMKVRLAWEEVHRAMSGFITVTYPVKVSNKRWITKAAVYNSEGKKIIVYGYIGDNPPKGGHLNYHLTGKIMCEDRYAESFSNLRFYSNEVKEPVTIPASINAESSYVLRRRNIEDYNNYLKSIGAKELESIVFEMANNWKELSQRLEELSERIDKIKALEEKK